VYTNVPTPLAMITNIDDKDLLIFIVGIDIVCVISFFLTMLKLKLKGDPTKAANKDLHGCWLGVLFCIFIALYVRTLLFGRLLRIKN
jgi:hypothetical protein